MVHVVEDPKGTDKAALNRAQDDDPWLEIFSVLVHDVESPLASMKYLLRLIEEERFDPVNPRHRKLVDSTGIAVERAESIIYDIMAIARSGKAGLPVKLERLVPDQIISETVLLASGPAQERDINVEYDKTVSGVEVTADPALLRRTLDNLLFNAVRHTPSGGEIRVYSTEGKNSMFIHVKDTGPGLDDIDPELLFEKYGQVKLRLEGRHRGVGLGLYFCKLAAIGMGGTVVADDHPEGGAVFSVKLAKVRR